MNKELRENQNEFEGKENNNDNVDYENEPENNEFVFSNQNNDLINNTLFKMDNEMEKKFGKNNHYRTFDVRFIKAKMWESMNMVN